MVEVGNSKGQKVLPLPMGWQQGKALGRDAPDTPRSSVSDDVAALEDYVMCVAPLSLYTAQLDPACLAVTALIKDMLVCTGGT